MIVGNTTIGRRRRCATARRREAGGLSGRPLFRWRRGCWRKTYVRVEGAFPLIGVGGIDSGAAALAKIKAGADLLQLYSGLVFRGLGVVAEIKAELLDALARRGREALRSGRRGCRGDDRGGVAGLTIAPAARGPAAGSARSGSPAPRRAGNTARASAPHRSPCPRRCRISRRTLSTMFQGSSPSADSTTPIRIDSRISLPSTASGDPPRKRLRPLAMRISMGGALRHSSTQAWTYVRQGEAA